MSTRAQMTPIEPTPPVAWTAVEPFTPEMVIEPSFVILVGAAAVPLFSVTAAVLPDTLTEPLPFTSTLSGAPLVAVAVAIGVFTLLLIVSVARATPGPATRQRGASATAATRVLRIQESPLGGLGNRASGSAGPFAGLGPSRPVATRRGRDSPRGACF